MDDLETFCVSANAVSKTFREDCSVAEEPQIQHDKRIEEVDANSNSTVRYISQMLLEEDTNEKVRTYEEELALLATERAFHDILRQEYYYTPEEPLLPDSVYQRSSVGGTNYKKSYDDERRKLITNGPVDDTHSINLPLESADPTSALSIESLTARQIQKGIDEAMKFVPNIGEFFINLGSNRSNSGRNWQSRTKRNHNYSDLDQFVGRLPKQIVVYTDEPIRNENFDKVLLLKGQKYIEEDSMLRKIMQKEMTDHSRQIQAKLSNNKMKQDKSWRMLESVDVRSLLITCSKAISVNNHPLAKELISEIRKYSSPHGDWSQRLAYYFVDGLEARLTGTSNEIYHKLVPQNLTVIEFLKVYHMYRVASPCRGTLVYFANQTILNNISKQTEKVHIINYGIMKGFQWPAFFEHFTTWEGFPPKIRMTIIEVPEPGLCPRRKVELTGRRMADYAKSFNVPFEYEAIVSEWQNVEVEDLKIANDEVVIVTCLVHSEKLSDEAVHANSPRDIFLNNIRKIKPRIFIHVAFNGPNNSPYFPHRFRAALSLYSSFFEMLDSNLPRGNLERLIIEKHFLMPAAINAIAFEGPNRVERPETYRHWHARKLRAGLVPLPVDPKIKKDVINFVQEHYHKEFVVEDDNGWLLLGWKGRILYGFTTWKASEV
ncbi:hypothetical protein LUZ62_017569 [Rhynchospora pubera]|uniref:GRAS family transcription factor n=1 Tax=Rhynchospora pubera TaxID=906938 RepID=A0AAV8GH55_9POAL|nr:hypothetical protein LUZ62_017569 [Rhynchospora pubera]